MQLLTFLVAGANAPFVISTGVALVFAALQMSGLLGLLSGGDADHDADVDADGGVDADGDVDGDVDAGGDADHDLDHDLDHDADHDGDADGDGEVTVIDRILGPLGVGRIPLSFVWQSFAMIFGVTGIVLNAPWAPGSVPLETLLWTLPIAAFAAYGSVAVLARLIAPVVSSREQEATKIADLAGLEGIVISSRVDEAFGEVRIQDRSGHVLRMVCRVEAGKAAVPEGASVVIVGREGAWLRVVPLELDSPLRARGKQTISEGR